MIHLFINALAASAGGGLTYVKNVIPQVAARKDLRATVLVDSILRENLPKSQNVELMEVATPPGTGGRFWFEQRKLPAMIERSSADLLLSTGNFALWNSPVPQILLSRNALYTSADFIEDLRRRGDYRLWLDTELKGIFAKASVRGADAAVAPSAAFAEELRQCTGKPVIALHHGFDAAAFCSDQAPLPANVQEKIAGTAGCLRLLFVSHYNYYRNFETLIRALPALRDELGPREVRLLLTCQLSSDANPGSYRTESAAALVKELGVSRNVVELGFVAYGSLHQLYRACDIYVTAAYAESFAHPLVEAMSMGLPVVASDLAVHREICDEAAIYFPRFSPEQAAAAIARVAASAQMRQDMSAEGIRRSRNFSWREHVEGIVGLSLALLRKEGSSGTLESGS